MQLPTGITWEGLLILFVLTAFAALWIYAFVHCWTRYDLTFGQKIAWTVVLFLIYPLGLIIYFACSSGRRRRSSGLYSKALDPVAGKPTNFD